MYHVEMVRYVSLLWALQSPETTLTIGSDRTLSHQDSNHIRKIVFLISSFKLELRFKAYKRSVKILFLSLRDHIYLRPSPLVLSIKLMMMFLIGAQKSNLIETRPFGVHFYIKSLATYHYWCPIMKSDHMRPTHLR